MHQQFAGFIQHYAVQIIIIGSVLLLLLILLMGIIVATNRRWRRLQQQSVAALRNAAYIDNLTGCSTMHKFRLDAELLLRNATPDEYIVLALDINNFKYINDTLGYDVGNHALWLLSQIFQRFARPQTLIARSYADNFIFMYRAEGYDEELNGSASMELINSELAGLLGCDYRINFSVGYYRVHDPRRNLSLILDCANIAKKSVKGHYTHRIAEYTDDMDRMIRSNRDIILAMHHALASGEFIPYLQPQYSLVDGSLCGAEVLVRWQTLEHGLLSPAEFIPIFEKNGFITRLDLYMFDHACAWMRQCLDRGIALPPRMSINASAITLALDNFVSESIGIVTRYSIDPAMIEIEMTESALARSPQAMLSVMHQLKAAGFWGSIDDFGSGYSSLHLLKDAPADILKLDMGFLTTSMDSEKGREIIASIIQMSHRLSLITVAEGVETQLQADELRRLGCDVAQGYLFARPMPIADFEKLLVAQQSQVI